MLGLLGSMIVAPAQPTAAAGFVVMNSNDSGAGSLRDAVAQANALAGTDTITFDAGLSGGTITLTTGTLGITDDVIIDASAAPDLIVSASSNSRVVTSNSADVELVSIHLRDGASGLGGAAFVDGDLTLRSTTISNSTASIGGGGALVDGNAFVYNSLITSNSSEEGGGLAVIGSALIDGSTLSGNIADDGGGALFTAESSLTVTDSTISDNNGCEEDGDPAGGGIAALGPVTVSDSILSNNTCTEGNGGAIHVTSDDVLPPVVRINAGSALTGNSAEDGGALFAEGVVVVVDDSTISDNNADDDGGGIRAEGAELSIDASTLSDNSANDDGGAVSLDVGLLTIDGSTFSDNNADDDGGAISVESCDAVISGSTLTNNSAGDNGGAATIVLGSLTMTATDVDDNVAADSGGGIFAETADVAFSIVGGSVSRNTASDGGGGGLYLGADGDTSLSITDTVFEANEAIDGDGGGLATFDADVFIDGARFDRNASTSNGGGISLLVGNIEFDRVELVSNSSGGSGGAVHNVGSAFFALRNSTVADNTATESGGGIFAFFGNDIVVEDSDFRGNVAPESNDDSLGGGALNVEAMTKLTVVRSTFLENTAVNGGGIRLNQANSVDIADSDFADNTATQKGGGLIILDVDEVEIVGGSVTGNNAALGGGVIVQIAESAAISQLTVQENTATSNVGGLGVLDVDSATLDDLRIRANAAPFGAGLVFGSTTEASITRSVISSNVSSSVGPDDVEYGGGIYSLESNLTVGSTSITGNTAGQGGGVLASGGSLAITDGTAIDGNTAGVGGGIATIDAPLTTAGGVTISGNAATVGEGGGVAAGDDQVTFVDTTIAGNIASAEGGGVSAGGTARFETSSVTDNEAGSHGGGVSARTVRAFRSLYANNSAGADAESDGGAIRARSSVIVSHSTFHANEAGGVGGAISIDSDVEEPRSSIEFLTVTDNAAGVSGGGIQVGDGGVFQPQGILAVDNTAPIDPDVTFPFAPEWSIIGDLGATPPVDLDGRPALGLQLGLDPLLGPLTDNGGPTETRMPTARSSALDAGGTVSEEVTDQRGTIIADGALHDVGAVKYDGPLPVWVPVTPARLVDTRSSGETIDGDFRGAGTLEAGDTLRVDIARRGGVPVSASGAIVNVTAVNPESVGFLTVFPCTETPPNASSVNYTTGVNLPNEVIAGLDDDGGLCVFSSARTQLAIDVVGYLDAPSPFEAINPSRLLDTRQTGVTIDGQARAGGRVPAGEQVTLQVSGRADIPGTAAVAVVNVVAINPSATGFVTVHSCLDDRPLTSSLNYLAGGNRGNEISASLDSAGQICAFTSAESHLVVDVVGYLDADLDVTAVQPARVFETRPGTPTVDGETQGGGRLQAGSTTRIQLGGRADVPSDAATVNINVTAINAELNGFLTVFACGEQPLAASLNYVPGVNGGNDLISGLNSDGELCVFTSAETDLTIDVSGYTTL